MITVLENCSPPKFVASIPASKREIHSLATVGSTVWSGSAEAVISIWDPKKFKLKKTLKGHIALIKVILPLPITTNDKKPIVWSGDVEGWVHVWKGTTPAYRFQIQGGQPVSTMVYNEASKSVWIGSFKCIFVYDSIVRSIFTLQSLGCLF